MQANLKTGNKVRRWGNEINCTVSLKFPVIAQSVSNFKIYYVLLNFPFNSFKFIYFSYSVPLYIHTKFIRYLFWVTFYFYSKTCFFPTFYIFCSSRMTYQGKCIWRSWPFLLDVTIFSFSSTDLEPSTTDVSSSSYLNKIQK